MVCTEFDGKMCRNAQSNQYGKECEPCMQIKANLNATRDSYTTKYVLHDIKDIIEAIETHPYNKYRGGKENSLQAMIYFYKKGYILHDCIKLRFRSEEECRQFESIIEDYVEYFSPREFISYE